MKEFVNMTYLMIEETKPKNKSKTVVLSYDGRDEVLPEKDVHIFTNFFDAIGKNYSLTHSYVNA